MRRYQLQSQEHTVQSLLLDRVSKLMIDDVEYDAELDWIDSHQGQLTLGGKTHVFYAAQDQGSLFIHILGRTYELEVETGFAGVGAASAGSGQIVAPMPGVVIEHYISIGSDVDEGAALMLIESMKMQIEIKATASGTVKSLGAQLSESFNKGDLLVEIE